MGRKKTGKIMHCVFCKTGKYVVLHRQDGFRYCSKICMGKVLGNLATNSTKFKKGEHTGEKNHNWKGGTTRKSDGYRFIHIGGVQVLEHRYLMEQHIGRKLTRKEHVHHINHNRSDNRLDNLEVIDISSHGRMHSIERWEKVKHLEQC